MVRGEVGASRVRNGAELALGAKVAVGVSVGDLLALGQGSKRLVGLSDGRQEVQRLLTGAELELLVGVWLDLNGVGLAKWLKHGFRIALCCASGAIDVGGCGGRVEHCFAVVDDEGVQALAVNDVTARACDAAGNLGVGLCCNVIKAQDASVARIARCRLARFGQTQPGPPPGPVHGRWSHCNYRLFTKKVQIELEIELAA